MNEIRQPRPRIARLKWANKSVYPIRIGCVRSSHPISDEHTLEFLLAFDGRVHHLEKGYWLKFEIGRVKPAPERPHGLRYSFTLHDPEGNRLVGFDNAHKSPAKGHRRAPVENDHCHRSGNDPGRPYTFTSADQLLADFFAEARRVLGERGVGDNVVGTSED